MRFSLLVFLMLLLAAPVGAEPRVPAEWEPALGTLVRYPFNLPDELVLELASDDLLYTLVADEADRQAASIRLDELGVDPARVVFIETPVTSPWTRDWGPVCVFEGEGPMHFVDAHFEGYPWVEGCQPASTASAPMTAQRAGAYAADDFVPTAVGQELGLEVVGLDVLLTGGNFMTDGRGLAFSTEQMLAENMALTDEATFVARVRAALGVDRYEFVPMPEQIGIQHIDCFAKFLDEETVLVKRVAEEHPEYLCHEAVAAAFAAQSTSTGRPWRVERIDCGGVGGAETAAYTNSLILNDKVLVPLFGFAEDAAALQTYRDLMPGYEVKGFSYGPAWFSYDALHCRTRALFDAAMLQVRAEPLPATSLAGAPVTVRALIRDHSEAGLVPGAQQLFWRTEGSPSWSSEALSPVGGSLHEAMIPPQPAGVTVEYWINAADHSGRHETWPPVAPEDWGTVRFEAPVNAPPDRAPLRVQVVPSPFNPRTTIRFEIGERSRVQVSAFDLRGRLLEVIVAADFPPGSHEVIWEPTGLASGTYLLRVKAGAQSRTIKASLVR